MKLFLAIDLPSAAKKSLNEQLQSWQEEYRAFNWVREENFYIILHSFGEVVQKDNITEKIKEVLFDQVNFHLYAIRLDFFMDQQITIYVDFRKEQKLQNLYDTLGVAFPSKQKGIIVPHVAVARCRIPSKQQYFVIKKKIERSNIDLSFQVKEVVLFENILINKKPSNKKVMAFPLVKTA